MMGQTPMDVPNGFAMGQPIGVRPDAARGRQPMRAIAQPSTCAWQEARDEEGRVYYHNSQTGVTQWERPPEVDMHAPPYANPRAAVVMGIPIDDPALAPIIKQVMILSGASALLILFDGIVSLIATGDGWFLFVGLCTLLIPACGYCGAKKKSRDFMCCFCGWSAACFVLTFINLIIIVAFVATGQLPDPSKNQPLVILVLSLIINAFSSALYFCSFYYGNKLRQNPYFEPPEVTNQMLAMQVLPVHVHQQAAPHLPPPMMTGTVTVQSNIQPAQQATVAQPKNQALPSGAAPEGEDAPTLPAKG